MLESIPTPWTLRRRHDLHGYCWKHHREDLVQYLSCLVASQVKNDLQVAGNYVFAKLDKKEVGSTRTSLCHFLVKIPDNQATLLRDKIPPKRSSAGCLAAFSDFDQPLHCGLRILTGGVTQTSTVVGVSLPPTKGNALVLHKQITIQYNHERNPDIDNKKVGLAKLKEPLTRRKTPTDFAVSDPNFSQGTTEPRFPSNVSTLCAYSERIE